MKLLDQLLGSERTITNNSQILQRNLFLSLASSSKNRKVPVNYRDVGFSEFSQTDDDGILLYIFSQIGFSNKLLVDIGSGNPLGSNSANLICNWGFNGLLIDGSEEKVKNSQAFYAADPQVNLVPPSIIKAWVSAENLNELIGNQGFHGNVDFFSLDLDGVDYWLWKSLAVIEPRVVMVEAQTYWGSKKSVTVPYSPDFDRGAIHPDYFGASINAFVKLGKHKGYRLVASNRYGFNLFFVKENLRSKSLPTITPRECLHYSTPSLQTNRENRLNRTKDLEWVRVS